VTTRALILDRVRAEAYAPAGPGIGFATPIPTTLSIGGQEFHVQAPPLTGADSDPSSVYNFHGTVGLLKTGEVS
jgi:hypothetical protein